MSVVFHVLAGAAVAHAATTRLLRLPEKRVSRPGVLLVVVAGLLAVLSHGVLDGLKHGYPLAGAPDILLSVVISVAWCMAVRPPLTLLFAVSIAGSLLPDVIDHTPWVVEEQPGITIPWTGSGPVFPWHWGDGSGSLWSGAEARARDLSKGRNLQVSIANHVVVVALSAGAILAAPWAMRFVSPPP